MRKGSCLEIWLVVLLSPVLFAGCVAVVPVTHRFLLVGLHGVAEVGPKGSFTCASIEGGASLDGVDAKGNPIGHPVNTTIDALQAGSLPGVVRVVVYFAGDVPHYRVGGHDAPTFGAGESGAIVRLRGRYGLSIELTWGWSEDYSGSRDIGPACSVIADGRLIDTGDGISVLGLGLTRAAPFRLATFGSPSRLVIDLATGPVTCAASWPP